MNFIRSFNLIPKLVCFLLAFVFWIYVMQVDSPDNEEVFEDIPVTVSGITALENERNLSIFSGYDTLIDITVKGKKSDISKYSSEDIVATVDVSKIEQSGMYNLELYFDLPSDLTFVKSSSSELNIFVDKRITANVSVFPQLRSYTFDPSKYSLGTVVCDTDLISVTGPESVIKEINHAAVEVNFGGAELEHSETRDGNIVLKNQNNEQIASKYLKFSKNTVQVTVPVYTYENIPLRAIGKYGYYNKNNSKITVSPETVRVKGEAAILDTIDHIDITTIDEKNFSESTEIIADITLPENVFPVEGQPTVATVSIELKGMTEKTFICKNIVIKNASDKDKFTLIDKSVTVTVLGDAKALNGLTADDITVTVDLSKYADAEGVIYPTATITFDNENGIVYEIGTYSVKLKAEN